MTTPICDFVNRYAESDALRLHMPGHKGAPLLGCECRDITEIAGADSLFEASGIILESEQNASALFGAATFYSTEGSSLCIRAMLHLIVKKSAKRGEKTLIFAGRNAHKAFLSAAALLDLDVEWIYPNDNASYLSCPIDAVSLDAMLKNAARKPAAVYLTSPDYLGNRADVAAIAAVCHANGVYLLVDNAHGAYLKFLPQSQHPIDLGADLCCDSAHKTLPALTGGAYLHIAKHVSGLFAADARKALALFGSTSPSYLTLQSLDAVNAYLASGYPQRLVVFADKVNACKSRLTAAGYTLCGDEPLKLTIHAKPYGYLGTELAEMLQDQGIVCEFCDPDFLVLMLTPETGDVGIKRLERALGAIQKRTAITERPPMLSIPERRLPIREAMLSDSESLPVCDCLGRVLADAGVGCPPAVPIAVCGEVLDSAALAVFAYYGITHCTVVKG
ncbi:MAG: aminotransferase class V-fold PLP-dependent enzyme [Clostridia bacterium]|nr:aminotransferase class V-fold PLP-dependent enzyme [Clostridia bacterium]